MYEMWPEYDERPTPDGAIDFSTISPVETMHIILGSGPKLTASIMNLSSTGNRHFQDLMYDAARGSMEPQDHGMNGTFWDTIRKSHQAQQKSASGARASYALTWQSTVKRTAQAALRLTAEGVFSRDQAERFQGWLMDSNGTPRVKYLPMSRLEYMRYMLTFHHTLPEISDDLIVVGNNETDFSAGTIISAHALHPDTQKVRSQSLVYQLVRASLSGLEIYDVSRDDGRQVPLATATGLGIHEPTTQSGPLVESQAKNAKIAAGLTKYIAQKLVQVEPSIGIDRPSISEVHKDTAKVEALKREYPLAYQAMIKAALHDASTPQDKRRAIAVMHEQADKLLGVQNSLERLFQGTGSLYQSLHASQR